MKIIIVTGMPGAGKGILAESFTKAKIPVIIMGDVIRNEAKHRGLDPNPSNTRKIMLELRERDGMGAVAQHCIETLKSEESSFVVIEGCRSIDEIDVFDDYAEQVTIIGVHASPATRFRRLKERARADAPPDWHTFRERDLREISVGLGGVISLSDIMIVNESSLEDMKRISDETVKKVLE